MSSLLCSVNLVYVFTGIIFHLEPARQLNTEEAEELIIHGYLFFSILIGPSGFTHLAITVDALYACLPVII